MKKYAKSIGIYVLIIIFIIVALIAAERTMPTETVEPYYLNNLMSDLKAGNVDQLTIERDTDYSMAGTATVILKDNTVQKVVIPEMESFMTRVYDYLDAGDVTEVPKTEGVLPADSSWIISLITPFIILLLTVFLMFFLIQQMQGGGSGNKVMSFGKTKAKAVVDEKKKVTFTNVAGLDEEKAELQEIVEFLKTPKKFMDIGARIPKGVLLIGPPGTGKTLLARAVAGEAGVPFFSISGSDFVEMFVGVGASRVRDLFEQAKKSAPCIIFIDEIDAVGRRRGAGLGGGHDEREQTLNQLLVEMDGFGANEGVIILAATNRPDILDPALQRPGRFDRQVVVGRPDVKGREEILNVHAKGKKLASDVDLRVMAQQSSGFTGADLENLMNEAALLAARAGKKEITMEELRRAFVKVGVGTEKKSRVISPKEKRITAYHEAGHAILFEVLPELDPVHIISVIPTGMAGGYTMPLPGDDKAYISKRNMEQQIISLLGGRAAEYLIIKDVTTGASNDIERATAIARNMVTKYGMSDVIGPIQLGNENEEVFIGREIAHSKNYSESIATTIDKEIKRIVDFGYSEAIRLLEEYMDVLHKSAQLLIEKEKITGEEFRALFNGSLPTKGDAPLEMQTQTVINKETGEVVIKDLEPKND